MGLLEQYDENRYKCTKPIIILPIDNVEGLIFQNEKIEVPIEKPDLNQKLRLTTQFKKSHPPSHYKVSR